VVSGHEPATTRSATSESDVKSRGSRAEPEARSCLVIRTDD
jgi:hypothetical protein